MSATRMRAALPLLILALFAACSADATISVPEAAPAPTEAPQATEDPAPTEAPPATEDPAPTEAPPATEDPAPTAEATTAPAEGAVVIEGRYSFDADAACEFNAPADVEVTCGWMTVPERWDDPADPDTVRFHVAVFHDPEAAAGAVDNPVVYLDGGPGGDTLESIEYSYDSLFADFAVAHDVVIWDQRGVSFSEPSLDCPEVRENDDETLDDVRPLVEETRAEADAFIACAERLRGDGVDLSAFNSVQSAHDLEALRQALGYDQWNLLGISYGTRLAQSAMREHPEGIRSVIIDSVVPMVGNLDTMSPVNTQRALDQLFAGCAADAACAEAYPDLEDRFYALLDRLDDDPLEFVAANALTLEQVDVAVNGDDVFYAVFGALYSQSRFAGVPAMIAQLEQGEAAGLATMVGQDLANGEFFSPGMLAAVRCHEEYPFTTTEEIAAGLEADAAVLARSAPEGAHFEDFFGPVCDAFGAGSAAPVENEAVASAIPTLVMEGQYDPVTPPPGGEQVAAGLEAAQYVLMPHQGHAALSDTCARRIGVAFLADPSAAVDTSCVAGSEAPPWVPTSLTDLELEPYQSEGLGAISGLAPVGWEEQSGGVHASPDNIVSQVVLFQQGVDGASADIVVESVTSNLDLADAEERDEVVIGDRTWRHIVGEIPGSGIAMFVTDDGGRAYLVLLQGPPDRLEEFTATTMPEILAAIE